MCFPFQMSVVFFFILWHIQVTTIRHANCNVARENYYCWESFVFVWLRLQCEEWRHTIDVLSSKLSTDFREMKLQKEAFLSSLIDIFFTIDCTVIILDLICCCVYGDLRWADRPTDRRTNKFIVIECLRFQLIIKLFIVAMNIFDLSMVFPSQSLSLLLSTSLSIAIFSRFIYNTNILYIFLKHIIAN